MAALHWGCCQHIVIFLVDQWLYVHTHGAKNSTSAGLPDLRTIESKLDGLRSMTAEADVPTTASAAVKSDVMRNMMNVLLLWRKCTCDEVVVLNMGKL